ncbi:MAG: hypothetical protein ACYTBS_21995 [Planctomycetota bacterium]|jgi:tRNA U34 5-carboxymethylaminomethyl modifying GTPase MnmE/TrmE
MYELSDTIVAVSSPTPDKRVIVRITGPETFNICRAGFCSPIESTTVDGGATHSALLRAGPRLLSGRLAVDDELEIDAKLYLFHAPHSYTGDDVAEIHVYANRAVTEVGRAR